MPKPRRFAPEDCADKRLCAVKPLARWLLLGLKTIADDQGVFRWELDLIRTWCLPNDLVDLNPLLHELEVADLVRPFQIEGADYGVIRDFYPNQRTRKPKSWYPMPGELRRFAGHPPIKAGKHGVGFYAGKDPFASLMARRKPRGGTKPTYPKMAPPVRRGRPKGSGARAQPRQDERSEAGVVGGGLSAANAPPEAPAGFSGRPQRLHPPTDDPFAPQINSQDKPLDGNENERSETALPTEPEQPDLGPELAPPPREYAFEGEALQLNRHDYDRWRMDCLAVPDFDAALQQCDAWLVAERQARGARFNPFLAGRAYMMKAARETAATVPGKIALRQRDPTNLRPMMQGLWNKRR